MSQIKKKLDRVLAILLSFMMIFSIMPVNQIYAMSDTASVLETNMDEIDFVVNTQTVFEVTSIANDDAGIMVKGSFEFSDPSAIEKLEYYETTPGYEGWYELSGEFGPESGFPIKDGTSKFRVTFNRAGEYTVGIALKDVDTKEVVCETKANITVNPNASKLVTDIPDKNLLVKEPTEFTVTSTANGVNAVVKGSFEFSDLSAIEKLEYYETTAGYEGWYELSGEFGPASGFELKDATSKFRVTFNKAGDYTVVIALKDVNTSEVVCTVSENVTVNPNPCEIETDILEKKFVVYETTEFSVTSIANADAGKMVKGYFDFSDESAIEKLEYYETAEGMQGWYELKTHEFGPESGFPVVDKATSKFRVTFNKAGNYKVKVSLKQVVDGVVSDETTLSSVETDVQVAKAKITDVKVEATDNIYNGSELSLVNVTGLKEGDIVTYKVNDEGVKEPKATNAGKYIVIVTVDRGENYEELAITISSQIKHADLLLGEIKVQGLEGVYTGEPQDAVSVTGQGDYELQYKLNDGEWVTTIPTVINAGSYTVKVKATKNNYNDKEVTVDKAESAVLPFNVYVAKAKQDDFGFTDEKQADLAYNSTATYKVKGGQPNCTIKYEVVEGAEYVSVDQEGKITALRAGGTAIIEASIDGNGNYLAASDTYTIDTIKAEQTDFSFVQDEYLIPYGTMNLTVAAQGGQSGKEITYEIVEGIYGTIDSVDNKGYIRFNRRPEGPMTIKATLAGNDNYNSITATVKVKFGTNDFSDKVNIDTCPESGWYTDTVVITSEAGYTISTTNWHNGEWKDNITIDTEGVNSVGSVYLRKEATGEISEAIAIDAICIDRTNPTDLGIDYSMSIIDTLFGEFLKEIFSFYDTEMTVTLTATDMVSKIDHFVYQIGDGEKVTINKENIKFSGEDGINAEGSFTIPANLNGSKITMWAYDTAGRSTELIGDKNLVIDDVDPVISVSFDNNDVKNVSYFKKFDENKPTRTATITIKEENFFKDYIYEEVYKNDENGEAVPQGYNYLTIEVGKRLNDEVDYTYTCYEPEFVQVGDVYQATIEFVDDADYELDIKFYDFSLNENVSIDYGTSKAPTVFTIDNTSPIVEIGFDDTNAVESEINKDYFKGSPVLTLKVTEHNFNAEDLDFTNFEAKDVTGADINIDDITNYFTSPEKWTREGDVNTASYSLKDDGMHDANYDIKIGYADLADNEAIEATSPFFCLDNVKPYTVADTEISYSKSVIDMILEFITFGFYDAEMEVTITAYDDTAGIDHFTYSYVVDYNNDKSGHEEEVGHKEDAGKENIKIPKEDIEFSEDRKKASATFKIPAQFRGYVSFTATDKYGHESLEFNDDKCIVVDSKTPIVNVTYDNNEVKNGNYYKNHRTATIEISADNFFKDHLYEEVYKNDENGVPVAQGYNYLTITVGKRHESELEYTYTNVEPEFTKDGDVYKATVDFKENADYTFDIKYIDKSHNVFDSYVEDVFTVDTTAPTSSIQIGTWTESIDGTKWDSFPEGEDDSRAFGSLSTNEKVTVTINSNDTLSGVDFVKHFRSDKILTLDEVKKSNDWITVTEDKDTITYDVEPDEQFVVYVCVVDMAGNEHYVSSDGVILDKTLLSVEKIAPEITIESETDKQPINDIYNTDVDVDVKVIDPAENGTYSGLKEITYNIYNVNAAGVEKMTQKGTLYTFDKTSGKPLEKSFDKAACIRVDRTMNNSNNVIIEVVATDNAGNVKTERHTIKIDITAPVIDISYDNNDVDSATYFDAVRKATIKISERNFKNEDVIITVIHTDDEGKETKTTVTPNFTVEMDGDTPKVYTFDGEDRDGSEYYVYTMDYVYDKDGDYKFEIEYADLASNKCTEKNFAEDTAEGTEYEFTIDMTKPAIKVTYDNNRVLNGNYYKDERVATIVITEHNLDPNGVDKDRITITVSASDDGTEIIAPTETQWTTNGNTHTATITYSADALYSFDVSVKDKAGNDSVDYVAETFYVDKTAPTLEISGVANLSANNGDVIPVITYSDTNYDADRVTITLTGANRDSVELDGSYSDIHNGRVFTFANFAKEQAIDDIYTLTAKLTDKAGNTTEKSIMFSVNRFGSTYALSEDAEKLNGTYVKEPVDVVMTETNADELSNIKITLFKDGETIVLKEDTDYRIDVEGGNGQWYHYTYTVFAKNFEEDGVYSLTVESDDKAGNEAKNDQDTKDTAINFGVDSTLPIINIENLDSETTYALDNMTVTMNVKDNLKLTKVIVELDGKEYRTWEAEELEEIIKNGGNFTFDIDGKSTSAHNLVVYAVDAAGNGEKISDTELPANTEAVEKFYVTTNLWVRYYTNPVLFYGSIVGTIVLAGFIVFLIYKKKKKEEK